MTLRWQAVDPLEGWRLHATAAFDQRVYRFRNDDGNQATATWKAAQNTPISQVTGEVFRLRIAIQETGGGSANNQTIVLQSNINGQGWFNVGPSSNGVRLGQSQHVADGTATTRQLTGTTGTFVPGLLLTETSGTNISFAGNDHTEVEWASLLITGDVSDGATVQFRVTINGALMNTTTASPSLTAIHPSPIDAPTDLSLAVVGGNVELAWNSPESSFIVQRQTLNEVSNSVEVIANQAIQTEGSFPHGTALTPNKMVVTHRDAAGTAIIFNDLGNLRDRTVLQSTNMPHMDAVVYADYDGFCYALASFTNRIRIARIDPIAGTWNTTWLDDTSFGSSFAAGGPALAVEGKWLYVVSFGNVNSRIHRIDLDTAAIVGTVELTGRVRGHAIATPPGDYLFATGSRTDGLGWCAKVHKTTLAYDDMDLPEGSNIVTDDITYTGDYLWLGLEANDGVATRVHMSSFTADLITYAQELGIGPNYGIYFDGTWLWAVHGRGSDGVFYRIHPDTHTAKRFDLPGLGTLNEIIERSGELYLTRYLNPSWTLRVSAAPWTDVIETSTPNNSLTDSTVDLSTEQYRYRVRAVGDIAEYSQWIETDPISSPPEEHSGGSVATVDVQAVGAGTKQEDGDPDPPPSGIIASDDFNRPDAPTLGWIEHSASLNWGIVSNQAKPRSGTAQMTLHPTAAPSDSYSVRATVKTLIASAFHGLAIRAPNTLGTTATNSGGAFFVWISGSTQSTLGLRRKEPGAAPTTVIFATSRTLQPDDVIEARTFANGDIQVFHNGMHVTALDHNSQDFLGQRRGGLCNSSSVSIDVQWDDFVLTDLAAGADPPGATTGLSLTAGGWSNVKLTYNAATDAESYQVEYERWNGSVWVDTAVSTTPSALTTHWLEELLPDSLYRVRVRGSNSGGLGDWSDWEQVTTGTVPPPPSQPTDFLLVPSAKLMSLPVTGPEWSAVKERADGSKQEPTFLSNSTRSAGDHLSSALVYARQGGQGYKDEVVAAIRSLIGMETHNPEGSNIYLTIARQLAGWILCADLVGMDTSVTGTNPNRDPNRLNQTFLEWIQHIRTLDMDGSGPFYSLTESPRIRASNQTAMGLMSRTACSLYLHKHGIDNGADLVECMAILRRNMGDRNYWRQFGKTSSYDWTYVQVEPELREGAVPTEVEASVHWVPINPDVGIMGGITPEDLSRSADNYPNWNMSGLDYTYGFLRGLFGTATLLERAYPDVWTWGDNALLRAMRFLETQANYVPSDYSLTDWLIWQTEDRYGVTLPRSGSISGRIATTGNRDQSFGYSDWLTLESAPSEHHATGGSAADVQVTPTGSGVKHASGGSVASVGVSAIGEGSKQVSGSSAAAVSVVAVGTGTKEEHTVAAGGSATNVTVTAVGAGTKHASGGSVASVGTTTLGSGAKSTAGSSTTTVTVTAVGTGTKEEHTVGGGGSAASVTITAVGSGVKHASGGSVASVGVSSIGNGAKAATGGSSTGVDITVVGEGFKTATSDSIASVDVEAIGAGTKHAEGGSAPAVTVTAVGTGTKEEHTVGAGGSAANVTVTAVGSGAKHASGGSAASVGVTVVGSGYKGITGSSFTSVEIDALGGGTKGSTAGSTTTVSVEAEGDGQKDTSGDSVAIVQVTAVGVGFNPEASLSHRDITIDVLPVTFHTTVKSVERKTVVSSVQLTIPGLEIHEVQLRDLRFSSPTVEWVFKPVVIGTELTIHEAQTKLFIMNARL